MITQPRTSTHRYLQRLAIAGLGLFMLISGHASAQDPQYAPEPAQWKVDGASGLMSLAPTKAKVAIGLPTPETALHIVGKSVKAANGTGTVTVGRTNGPHMRLDNNDIAVAGSSYGGFGSLYLQRYGGPVVVHGGQKVGDRVYITSEGDVGVGTADPQQFAIDRNLVMSDLWTKDEGVYQHPILAVDGYILANFARSNYLAAKRVRIGSGPKATINRFAYDGAHPDARLQVEGKISAQSIVVHLDKWADDVFDDSYALLPIDELADFVSRERHLPGVPTESEALRSGLDVAASSELMLRKVEELTLYTIAQQKKIDELERKIDALAR